MLFQNVICRFKQDRSNLFGKQIFAKKCTKMKKLLAYSANLCAEFSIFARKKIRAKLVCQQFSFFLIKQKRVGQGYRCGSRSGSGFRSGSGSGSGSDLNLSVHCTLLLNLVRLERKKQTFFLILG